MRTSTVLGCISTLIAVVAGGPVAAQPYAPGSMDWGYGHMMFGGLMMILFWGAVIVAVVLVARWLSAQGHAGRTGPGARRDALDILRERFARGEINEEEFDRRRQLLRRDSEES